MVYEKIFVAIGFQLLAEIWVEYDRVCIEGILGSLLNGNSTLMHSTMSFHIHKSLCLSVLENSVDFYSLWTSETDGFPLFTYRYERSASARAWHGYRIWDWNWVGACVFLWWQNSGEYWTRSDRGEGGRPCDSMLSSGVSRMQILQIWEDKLVWKSEACNRQGCDAQWWPFSIHGFWKTHLPFHGNINI